MTHLDVVAMLSVTAIVLAIAGSLAERVLAERQADPRRMAHRVK